MIILKIINASFLWILGLLLVRHVIKHWNRSGHILEKISEIFQSFLFFLIGYYITILYSNNNPFYLQLDFYIFIIFSSSVILFVGLNIFPNYLKKKFNKHYRANISYNSFISEVNEKYNILNSSKRSRIINDLSRKILHIIQFALLLLIYHISLAFSDFFSEWAYSPVEIRNFFFISFAGFFWIMIMSGELLRTDHWEYLPKWAWKWYKKSLDPNRELWRLNASIAILLTNLIWIHPIFPIQVLLIATWISCISDGMASIIGKNFGKHKIF